MKLKRVCPEKSKCKDSDDECYDEMYCGLRENFMSAKKGKKYQRRHLG